MSLCQYPTVARALYRSDFEETAPVAVRRVSIPAMVDNSVGFSENFSLLGGANIKEFSSVVPQQSLGVGPVVMEFHEGPVDKPVEQRVDRFMDDTRGVLRSASGQVRWDYSGRGYFTLDTPGTQGVVGFAGGKQHRLTDVSITVSNPLAFVYISAMNRDGTIAGDSSLIITTIGRVLRKGTVTDEVTMNAVQKPDSPDAAGELVEPVVATIELQRTDPCRIVALDHAGRKSGHGAEVPVERMPGGCRFTLDGGRCKTMYYLVEFE